MHDAQKLLLLLLFSKLEPFQFCQRLSVFLSTVTVLVDRTEWFPVWQIETLRATFQARFKNIQPATSKEMWWLLYSSNMANIVTKKKSVIGDPLCYEPEASGELIRIEGFQRPAFIIHSSFRPSDILGLLESPLISLKLPFIVRARLFKRFRCIDRDVRQKICMFAEMTRQAFLLDLFFQIITTGLRYHID